MDLKKLSLFILSFGVVIVLVGVIKYTINLDLSPPPPPSPSERFSWQEFANRAQDKTKNALGVAILNQERAVLRGGAIKIIVAGGVIILIAAAVRYSIKPKEE